MTRAVDRTLEGGACKTLSPEIVDKYFFSNGATERFQYMTAKAICGGCAVRAACLEDAIVVPPGHGIRGGERAEAIWQLHARWMDQRADIDELISETLNRQKRLGGLGTTRALQAGHFEDVPLVHPEIGS